ncbi:hypothetical protein LIER_10722 [Lithospermum erythrorhizon]|uniref:C2 domain-containing protein n=1 Tax=Lithospermum erythrorhizon TaxID=34254 RepID=A0AAV3PKB0_LITER
MGHAPFQLLELTVISAQDLAPVSKKLRTYAMTWIHTERKLRTRIDQHGQINPTWNDKFVFRVDDDFLNSETSAVMLEIYALGWLKDIHVGSVRVLINNLIPAAVRAKETSTRRFVALQIRRRSGRPQGIVNVCVSLLDNTMRSMPLYTDLSASAVGFQELMDVQMYKQNANRRGSEKKLGGPKEENEVEKIQLRHTNSDRTELATKEKVNQGTPSTRQAAGSDAGLIVTSGSIVNGSMHNGSSVNGSLVNGSEIGASDIGPSSSVVAAAVARGLILTPIGVARNPGSSILGDWETEESDVEGLRSKIDRWRTELPSSSASKNNNDSIINYMKSKKNTSMNKKRHVGGGNNRPFSCFGKAFGCEFSIVCGRDSINGKSRLCDSELAGSSALTPITPP